MADSKRNNVAGKIATPKTGGTPVPQAPPIADTLEALGKAIGAHIKLTTAAPHAQTYEGTLFTACSILNVVALNTRTSVSNDLPSQPGDYHVIPLARILTFQIISLSANTAPRIGAVDVKRLKEREQARINKEKEDERNKGKGVTTEAQAIFNSFRRINMPIRWHNQDMVVQDAVIITSPYRVEDCKGPKDKQEMLIRVRKVLETERKKIREREEKERKTAVPLAARKGG